ncbi:MAG: histidine kinase [Lachnospiraceae bacterium]|nr:histidine kinase [Lachnospiraceae bacterium]
MPGRLHKPAAHSLKCNILRVFGLSVIPVLAMMFVISQYSIRSNIRNAYGGIRNFADSNRNMVDTQLNEASNFLRQEYSDREMLFRLSSTNQSARVQAYSEFGRELFRQLNFHPMLEGVMLLSTNVGDSLYRFTESDSHYRERQRLLDYISQHREDFYYANGTWQSVKIGDEWVLLSSVGDSDVLLVGWIWYSRLYQMLDIHPEKIGETILLLSENDVVREGKIPKGLVLTKISSEASQESFWSGMGQRWLAVSVPSETADLKLASVIDRNRVAGGFYILQFITLAVAVLYVAVLAPWLLHVLKKCVFLPIGRMEEAMKAVENGNLDMEIDNHHSSQEMDHLICSFNSMIAQVRTLKIQSYEDALEKQKLQMNYLQLQIEPHFYLNALNLINTMAQVGDTDLIRKLTLNLSTYLRYIVGTREGKTTVREEVAHIGNYLEIIRIRMGDAFRFECHVEDSLQDLIIPPLLIQMLVENSMKYAFDMYGDTYLSLNISKENGKAVFLYHDNGPGFPAAILKQFRSGEQSKENHIGLWNIRQRLNYMYPGSSSFAIWNDGGAWTSIIIDLEKR